ncbi:TadE/TadG family type IV pilus assembly protein [Pelagibaculum spongiae]|uniref:TadE-like domain-containing protein n=1 Tax=Pelagibaculum spongiae TaxID=2080658 RepID=A0A2V1GZH1_9GAMM|nr:TadE family protein [Pelagibaculum spongiae]PVZ68193.1 hypothetical protein DC094_12905 [Pelagibaculum spongiae]
MNKKQQRGQSLTETAILMPVLVLLIMGLIQVAQMYKAKATLNHATVQAARAGATENGFLNPMRNALAQTLAPAEYRVKPNEDPNMLSYFAFQQLFRFNETIRGSGAGGVKINVLSPTQQMFDSFRQRVRTLEPCRGVGCPSGGKFRESQPIWQIPNDNLNVYSDAQRSINGRPINLQDANLLKIESTWCYPLRVPFINAIIYQAMKTFRADGGYQHEQWTACRNRRVISRHDYWIPLTSTSVVRMQSPLRCENNPRGGSNCDNLQ